MRPNGFNRSDASCPVILGPACDGDSRTSSAEFDSDGQIKIIDRKKNLVKTAKGEYIALEKLEVVYKRCPLIVNVCVHAAPDRDKPLAIVVPAPEALLGSKVAPALEGLQSQS